ncbi:MAG TPA: DNA replication and repair protein RecF [Thermoanaerobaculia bacterium]|jgi:DNA replication and repair protein RecF
MAGALHMILRSLITQNFRNLASEEVSFHPHMTLVVGRNGQGKTNLLEAIYFLATTKSFRTPHLASVVRFDTPSVFAQGTLARGGVEKTLSIGLESESRRRVLMINEERVTLSRYLNAMSVFAYSSARLEILRGSPEERRRFLDRGIASVDPAYLDSLSRYGRVLKQRNALLQEGKTLDAWDEELAQAAGVVQKARERYAASLANAFANIVECHAYHVRALQMIYRPSLLPAKRSDELRAGMTLAGPQRDQLDFAVAGRAAAEVLSGGEQKMIVLFLKFAKLDLFRARFDEPALFLLDDLDAELDLEILEQLLLGLPAETQVFATSAKERFLSALAAGPHRRLLIENGRVTTGQDFT